MCTKLPHLKICVSVYGLKSWAALLPWFGGVFRGPARVRSQAHCTLHARTHARTHTHTHTYTRARAHTHAHTHIQSCTHKHAHAHTHTHCPRAAGAEVGHRAHLRRQLRGVRVCVRVRAGVCVCVRERARDEMAA